MPADIIDTLREQLAQWEQGPARAPDDVQPSRCPDLDALLPQRGWPRGWLVEWLTDGSGAATLALSVAADWCRAGKCVVVDRRGEFYPPAAVAAGIPEEALILVRPPSAALELWAFEQALQCPGVALAWLACDRLTSRDFRRLQLAAENGRGRGFLFRPAQARGAPSWAHAQWLVRPLAGEPPDGRATSRWRLQVTMTRCRGSAADRQVLLELDEAGIAREVPRDDRPLSLPALAELAPTAAARCPA